MTRQRIRIYQGIRVAHKEHMMVSIDPPAKRADLYSEGWIGIHAYNQEGVDEVLPLLVKLRKAGLVATLAEFVPATATSDGRDSARIIAKRTNPRGRGTITVSRSAIREQPDMTAEFVRLELEHQLRAIKSIGGGA